MSGILLLDNRHLLIFNIPILQQLPDHFVIILPLAGFPEAQGLLDSDQLLKISLAPDFSQVVTLPRRILTVLTVSLINR
jgi:hypothetical protein